jgi:NADH-quinone oxidoreductase subunit C
MTDDRTPSDETNPHDEQAEKAVADAIEEAIDTPSSIEAAALVEAAEIEEIEDQVDHAVAEAEDAAETATAVDRSGRAGPVERAMVHEAEEEISDAEEEIDDAEERERGLASRSDAAAISDLDEKIEAAEDAIDEAREIVEIVAEQVEERARILAVIPALESVAATFPTVRFELQTPLSGAQQIVVHVDRDRYAEFMAAVRDAGFEMFIDLCGVDYLRRRPRFEVVVNVVSMQHTKRLRVRVGIEADDPSLPSICLVYPGANFFERETYDLLGIRFEGHPDLSRILMPDDWEGHPLRKDYSVGSVPVQFKEANKAT